MGAVIIGRQGFDLITSAVLAGVPEEKIEEAFALSHRLNGEVSPDPVGNGAGRGVPALTQ